MQKKLTLWAIIGSAALASATTLIVQRVRAAGIPATGTLTYTGQLENPDGSAVTAASKNIGITAYDAATGGNILLDCSVTSGPVTLTSGRFQIALPSSCAARISDKPDLWLEVSADGASLGRTKLGAVPFAVEAGHAANATAAESAANATTASSALVAANAAALNGAVKVQEAASDASQVGVLAADLVYTKIGVNLTPGTWLVNAEASLRTTDVSDNIAMGLYDATNSADIPNSRSGLGVSTNLAFCSLHASKVLSVTVPTTIRVKGYRNGGSTLEFGSSSTVLVLAGGRNRISAVKLSDG